MIGKELNRHALLIYFALTFGVSGGGIGIVLATTGLDLSPMKPLEGGLLLAAKLLGPSVSGLVMTACVDGRTGLRRLGGRALRWRVAPRWYAVALLTVPLILMTILWPLGALLDPAFKPRNQWPLLAVGLLAGGFEEIGWTGFAAHRLLARHSAVRAGVLIGVPWALWHLLVDCRYNLGAMGVVWPLEFTIVYLSTLTPYRMLMTWVYSHTQSLLLAIIMHASFTGWLLVLFPLTDFPQSLAWQASFALVLWCAVAIVIKGEAAHAGTIRGDGALWRH